MADLFKCDKCGHVGSVIHKAGRLIVQEFIDGQPHAAQYNAKAELCHSCLDSLKNLLPRADFGESQRIIAEGRGQ